MRDARVEWVVSLAVMMAGFVLSGPTEGWLQVVVGILLFGGMLASGLFFFFEPPRNPAREAARRGVVERLERAVATAAAA